MSVYWRWGGEKTGIQSILRDITQRKHMEEKLEEQEEAERMSKEKVTEWIETRIRKLERGRSSK